MLKILFPLLILATYPVLLPIFPEAQGIWRGSFVYDIFYFYRAFLLVFMALMLPKTGLTWAHKALAGTLLFTTLLCPYPLTALFGHPNYYEGTLVILSYIVLMAQEDFPENSIYVSIYLVSLFAILELLLGSYFKAFTWILPNLPITTLDIPLHSTFGQQNHLGLFCSLLFPFCLIKEKYIPALCLFLMAIGTQTRGAWLSILITTVIIYKKDPQRLTGLFFLALPFWNKIFSRLKTIDLDGRDFIWKETIPQIKRHWLLGSAPGTYAIQFPQFIGPNRFASFIVDRPHNIYLQVLCNGGIISFLILGFIFYVFFKTCKDNSRRIAVLGFLIAGLFTDSVVSVTPFLCILLGSRNENSMTRARRNNLHMHPIWSCAFSF